MRNAMVRSSAAVVALVWTLAPGAARAGETAPQLDQRVKELEARVRELESLVEQQSAIILRLNRKLAQQGETEPPAEEPDAQGPDAWPHLGPNTGQGDTDIDEFMDRVEKELDQLNEEFGLPGGRVNPPRGPTRLGRPWGPSRSGRAFLGIEMDTTPRSDGVLVRSVVPGSPAAAAGLKAGDVIVEVAGLAVRSHRALAAVVESHAPGDKIAIAVARAGKRIDLDATLASSPGTMAPLPGLRGGLPGGVRAGEKGEGDSLEVKADIPGGQARIIMSVPGLFLAPEMARNLGLTDDERKAVADAFARARDDLAKELVRIAVDSGGAPDPARLMQARHEAEGAAREGLRASLPAAKLEALGRFQEKAGAQSRVSLSMERGSGPPGPKEPVTPPIWGGEKPLGIEPAPDDEGGDVREF